MSKKKTIAYITGTRADFGLMTSVLRSIEKSKHLKLSLYATGMHLMPKYGSTINEVKKEFPTTKKIPAIFPDNTQLGVGYFFSSLSYEVCRAFKKERPDFVLTLGDRPEMLAIASVCLYLGIPTGHIHGGEKTLTVDEVARHAITKLSQIHFPATAESALRIKKLGEEAWRIHIAGSTGFDAIRHTKIISRSSLLHFLGFAQNKKFILITQHPVSEEINKSRHQMQETVAAAKALKLPLVIIYPNADPGSEEIIQEIEKERKNPDVRIFKNAPYDVFLSLQKHAALWIGNSSAGIIESGYFGTPVINVGMRQTGRECGGNVKHVSHSRLLMYRIGKHLLRVSDKMKVHPPKSPYGAGNASRLILRILETLPQDSKLLKKQLEY